MAGVFFHLPHEKDFYHISAYHYQTASFIINLGLQSTIDICFLDVSGMKIGELIERIVQKHKGYGIDVFPPASVNDIQLFEKQIGFSLPDDFREFYSICNGLGCLEDIFNITPLTEITAYPDNYGWNWFYFAEYMMYSDMWGLKRISNEKYEIFSGSYPSLVLTTSLHEFLERFLLGNIFESGGLYEWQDEIEIRNGRRNLENNK